MIRYNKTLHFVLPLGAALAASLAGCDNTSDLGPANTPEAITTKALQTKVQNIVVIYAENRAFDNLYGNFPGANGLSAVVDSSGKPTAAYVPQLDRDGKTVLQTLPQTWGGVTAPGNVDSTGKYRTVTQMQSANLANAPFSIENAFTVNSGVTLATADVSRDLYHRFFENQMQIGTSGKNDGFAAWADAGGLTMGHFDSSKSKLYGLAQQFVLADNFFQGAYGGSFLNHQYLICACAPQYPNADAPTTGAKPSFNTVVADSSGKNTFYLKPTTSSPASALDGPPSLMTGNIAPKDYFGTGDGFRAVNTMQPPYQPSGNAYVDTNGNDALYANPAANTTLPPQTQTNIGDLLSAKNINWKWYGGAWTNAVADGTNSNTALHGKVIYYQGSSTNVPNPNYQSSPDVSSSKNASSSTLASASTPRGTPDFQTHHQPFNYYANLDPVSHAADRSAHLQDYNQLVSDAAAGTLPPVAFYKPQGNLNQHEGYANVDDGDAHIADLVAKLQASPQYANMVIVITYDEFGGAWDHVAPPKGDLLGPGTRIPALIISPLAKKGTVDHTQYDTASILRLITRRFDLTPLAGLTARDTALKANGGQAMGDLTNALNL